MATLNLPDSPQALVWRLVKARLKADAGLASGGVALQFLEGDRSFTADAGASGSPSLNFVATMNPMNWAFERAHSGALAVYYWCALDTLDDEDVLNLHNAVAQALYPDDGGVFRQSLIDAGGPGLGAMTGQPVFSQPLQQSAQSAGSAGLMKCQGQFTIEVLTGFAV